MSARKSTGKSNTRSSGSSAQRRNTSSQSRKNTTRRSTTNTSKNTIKSQSDAEKELKRNVTFCVMVIVCLFLFCCMIELIKGAVGPAIKSVMLGIFGTLAFVMPFIVFFITWLIVANKNNGFVLFKISMGILFMFALGIFLALVKTGPKDINLVVDSTSKVSMLYDFQSGGGVIFGGLASMLVSALSKPGAIVLDIIIAIATIFLFTGKSFINLISSLFERVIEDDRYYEENDGQKRLELKGNVLEALQDKKYLEKKDKAQDIENNEKPVLLLPEISENSSDSATTTSNDNKTNYYDEWVSKREREKEEKKKEQDRKDDERIVNASRNKGELNNLNKDLIKENKPVSHDDIHEITLRSDIPDDVIANGNLDNTRVFSKPIKPMEEITAFDDVKEGHDESSTDSNVVIKIHSGNDANADILAQKISNSSFNKDEDTVNIKEEKEDYVPSEKIIEDKPIEVVNKGTTNVSQINDTPMEFNNGFQVIKQNSPDIDTISNPDISSMPDPVTERTHEKANKELEKKEPQVRKIIHKRSDYKAPGLELLKKNEKNNKADSDRELKETALKLQETLKTFGVPVSVSDISQGPSVTRYELTLGEGVKVNKIVSLTDDIKYNLAAQDIRIEAPIPGKAAVGIEIPNKETSDVLVRDLLESTEFKKSESNLSFAVGKDISGKTIVADIAKMPHMLIAGSTGSGKSVCINTLIMSILYKAHPDDVKLIMIDPKVVELSVYNDIPHLMIPVVTEPKKASAALKWAVNEMTLRYNAFAEFGVRDLKGFNEKAREAIKAKDPNAPEIKPQIIVIVDELADLMMVAAKEVEESICRLAQLARAAGIHLIIATQRPSVDVITGLIKANMPSRVAFRVSSGVDSRTILDMVGAERLLGKGDMLFYPQGYPKPLRVQGAFVSDSEVQKVTDFLKNNNKNYITDDSIDQAITSGATSSEPINASDDNKESGVDDLFKEACRLVVEQGSASSGKLQRVYRIGFNRAARMIDKMEEVGIVGKEQGTKPRQVLVSKEELENILQNY